MAYPRARVRVYRAAKGCSFSGLIGIIILCHLTFSIFNGVWGNDNFCGKVTTVTGDVLELRRDQEIHPEAEFEKIRTMKLVNATFESAPKCKIKVCGFTSYSTLRDGCIGSASDFMDCKLIGQGSIPADIVNVGETCRHLFNVSSISCGCHKENLDCRKTCPQKRKSLFAEKSSWKANECAVLYQENGCQDCYFNGIALTTENSFTTDNSKHINTMLVREGCKVDQYIPAFNRICIFSKFNGNFSYDASLGNSNIKSAFLSDPERFTCTCNGDGNPTTSEIPPESTTPTTITATGASQNSTMSTAGTGTATTEVWQSEEGIHYKVAVALLSVLLIITLSSTICLAVNKKWKILQIIGIRKPDNDNNDAETNVTELTVTTTCASSIEYSHIINSPFDPTFETSSDHFVVGDRLGGGHFGEVCEGSLRVAIKRVKNDADTSDVVMSMNSLQHEIKILSHLGPHENVVRLLGASFQYFEQGEIHLIIELCENGSLKDYLQNKVQPNIMEKIRNRVLMNIAVSDDGYHDHDEEVNINACVAEGTLHDLEDLDPGILRLFLKWCEEIANGMDYITSRKVVHVDLAARNVLLTHNLVAKIGDFGLSRKIYISDYVSSHKDSIPIFWVAPETLTENKYSTKSDVWAYGVTLWEIFSLGSIPYSEKSKFTDVLGSIIQGKGLDRPQFAPEYVYAKLVECWSFNPQNRPFFDDLRKYFSDKRNQLEVEQVQSSTVEEQAESHTGRNDGNSS